MSEQITEERIKMILSKREKMLRDINEKVILLIKDLDRSDDDLITEKSIHAVSINMMPSAKGGLKKDLSDLVIKLQRDREERKNELYKMIRLLSDQEYMINRVWACFLALDDPYYTMLNQLSAKIEAAKEFDKEDELNQKLERLSELNALLDMDEKREEKEKQRKENEAIKQNKEISVHL